MEAPTSGRTETMASRTRTLPGGRYRLDERIGRGGMADVFRAEDVVLHRMVAVKLFRFDTESGDERARVDAEVHTLARLRHPGLVTVFDAGTIGSDDEATPFLVMELVNGPTLSQRLAGGPIRPGEAARLGAQLAITLDCVHANAVVHRDIKPANILLDETASARGGYAPKLADFGIARILDSARLTMQGMTVGTANYLSPEQARGEPVGPASDVYSLGLVLIECLTGRPAYPGSGLDAALARLRHAPPVPAEFGPRWAAVLAAMTATDPAARPSAADVAAELSAVADEGAGEGAGDGAAARGPAAAATTRILPEPAPGAVPPAGSTALLPPGEPAPRRHRRFLTAPVLTAVVLAVLAVAVAVVLALQPSASTSAPRQEYPPVPGVLGTHLQQLQGAVP